MKYLFENIKIGFKYALYFLVIVAVMGAVFGAFGGMIISPMLAAIAYLGIFVIINLLIATILGLLNTIPSAFNKGSKQLTRYFGLSFSFGVIFLLFFVLLKLSGATVF